MHTTTSFIYPFCIAFSPMGNQCPLCKFEKDGINNLYTCSFLFPLIVSMRSFYRRGIMKIMKYHQYRLFLGEVLGRLPRSCLLSSPGHRGPRCCLAQGHRVVAAVDSWLSRFDILGGTKGSLKSPGKELGKWTRGEPHLRKSLPGPGHRYTWVLCVLFSVRSQDDLFPDLLNYMNPVTLSLLEFNGAPLPSFSVTIFPFFRLQCLS